jgi:GT2 family glycosyltransferase
MSKIDLSISVVLYKNAKEQIEKLLLCIRKIRLTYRLYLIDNSPTNELSYFAESAFVKYRFNNANLGFGAGHNIAIKDIVNSSKYHLVMNADIFFTEGLIEELVAFLDNNKQYAHLMPKVLYPNGEIQYLCRNKPTLFDIILKRMSPAFIKKKFKNRLDKYEFKDKNYDEFFYDVPFLSGCFMLFRTEALTEVSGFDESIFLYFEDADITQKLLLRKYHNVYYPLNYIYHNYEKGTAKSFKLALYAWKGLFKYLYRWGFY